jgi:hypothetical protein
MRSETTRVEKKTWRARVERRRSCIGVHLLVVNSLRSCPEVGTNHIGVMSRGNREITFGEPPRAKTYRPEGWRSLDCRPWGALTALTTEKSNLEPIHGKNKGGKSRNREEAGGQGAEARKLGYGGSLREEAPEDRGNKDEKRPAAGTRRTLEIGLWQLPGRSDRLCGGGAGTANRGRAAPRTVASSRWPIRSPRFDRHRDGFGQ